MAKFPEPPGVEALSDIPPSTKTLPAGTEVARIFFTGSDHPTNWDTFRYFGPTASRFDHHQVNDEGQPHLQERGMMYLAAGKESIPTCLAEVFQTSRVIDRYSRDPILAGFKIARPVELLDLRGPFATAVGASMAINTGARPRARRWAQQFYDAYYNIDGILYCSSMYAFAPAVALFERALDAIPSRPVFHRELKDVVLSNVLNATAKKIGYGLI